MAEKNDKKQPFVSEGTDDPNTLFIQPTRVGDLFVNKATKTLYFAYGLRGDEWGTAGTT